MARTQCTHNEVYRYWCIECISLPLPNAGGNFVFKGKTLEGAIKSAKRHCDNYTKTNYTYNGQSMKVGKVLYECNHYGKKVIA